jgi:tRNA(Ile)-lysidine synthase TilS/MesJ
MNALSFVGLLCAFGLGFSIGGVGGIVLGFAWYERKCGLLADKSGERAAAIRAELDDVFDRRHEGRRSMIRRANDHGRHSTPSSDRIKT